MASQNIIVKGKGNPVVFSFTFKNDFATDGLSAFSEIKVNIGSESYSTIDNPDLLFLNGNFELRLKIGDTTSLDAGRYTPEIIGYTAEYDDGYVLSNTSIKPLSQIKIV